MDARSPIAEKSVRSRFSAALSSAFSEWILIILLLIDAFSLYLATKICRSCKLQIPCLLCSRFGYLLGNEKLGFYRDLVCDAHKLEISSLVFCHVHQKLANAREMCEICLLSSAKKMSSLETSKFFPGKLSMDLDEGNQILYTSSDEMIKVPLLKKAPKIGSLCAKPCSCCSQTSRNKPYPFRLFQNMPIFKEFAYSDSPLSGKRLRARAHLPDGLSKTREILPMPIANNKHRDHSTDHLSYFRYRQLKFTSESEPEVLLSDDDTRSTKARVKVDKEEFAVQSLKPSSSITNASKKLSVISDNLVPEKLIHPDPAVFVASASVLKEPDHEDFSCDKSIADFNTDPDNGWKEKPNPPITSEIVSIPVPSGISNDVDASRTSATHVEIKEGTDIANITSKEDNSDLNLSSSAKGAQPTPYSEIALVRESARLYEDLKQRLSQIPSPRWLQYPWTDVNQHKRNDDECKLFHSSSFHGMPSFNKRLNVELPGSEYPDGSIVSEVEGEVAVDRLLKRQVERDRNSLSMLYKELEEERNASAIAANQAMAMINKLQEEKAAMQLEIMQYLRMMEEQTEYEQEALRNLNDQLAEREKEIQDLEAELESCRKSSRDESLAEKALQQSFDSDESEYSTTSTPHVLKHRGKKKHHRASAMFQDLAWYATGSAKENLLDLEDERQYISESLKRLEKNVCLLSNVDSSRHDEDDDEFNDECCEDDAKGVNLQQGFNEDEKTRHTFCSQNINGGNCEIQEMISPEKQFSPTHEPEPHESHNRIKFSFSDKKHLKTGKRNDVIVLGDEVEHLNARLGTLEADRDFLERTINTLRNGKDGLQFVREIATHLRELRKVGLTQREDVLA